MALMDTYKQAVATKQATTNATAPSPAAPAPTKPHPTPTGLTPAGPPITSSTGDGFGSPPSMVPGGSTITSTAGDGFGSPPTSLPTSLPPTPAAGPVQTTPTDPNNPLTMQTIQPGAMADRFKLAQDRFNTFTQATEPAYQAALRDANRMGAANGMLNSGGLRTQFGNLAADRSRALETTKQSVFNDALGGSIDDAWRAIGLAQQQQGFQAGQQNDAFAQALARWQAGQVGGTGSSSQAAYGGQLAGQGQDALSALNTLITNQAAGTGQPTQPPAPAPDAQKLPADIDWRSVWNYL